MITKGYEDQMHSGEKAILSRASKNPSTRIISLLVSLLMTFLYIGPMPSVYAEENSQVSLQPQKDGSNAPAITPERAKEMTDRDPLIAFPAGS